MEKGRIEKIDEYGNKCFRIEINRIRYSFNVNYLPENKYGWFIDVISKLLHEVFLAGQADTRDEIKQKFDIFLESFK